MNVNKYINFQKMFDELICIQKEPMEKSKNIEGYEFLQEILYFFKIGISLDNNYCGLYECIIMFTFYHNNRMFTITYNRDEKEFVDIEEFEEM
jgi:hypothetical protein